MSEVTVIKLGDDGTMDTVIVCTECGEEFRFMYHSSFEEVRSEVLAYNNFVNDCITEVDEDHECEEDL